MVSVVIPVRSLEDPDLEECLEPLRNQEYEGDVEVIVVGGGNIAQARNHGLERAKGQYIGFIDSDCVASRAWLSTLVKYLEEHPEAGGVGGASVSPTDEGSFTKSIDCVHTSYMGSLGSTSLTRTRAVREAASLSTSNCMYRAEVLREVWGFDERFELNEDTNLSVKVRERGHKLLFVPDSIVHHKRYESLRDFTYRFFSWGVSRMRAMMTDRRLVDARILGLFIASLLMIASPLFITGYLKAFIINYLALITVHGVLYSLSDGDPALILYIPIMYLIEHGSFFSGLVIGLLMGPYRSPDREAEHVVRYEHIDARPPTLSESAYSI